jgi:prephenate dehydrogenase
MDSTTSDGVDRPASERRRAGAEQLASELLVVGAGTVGRWLAGVLAAELDSSVAFADADRAAADAAAEAVGGRAVALDTDERFAAVCVAVPISAAAEAVATHAPRAEHALYDVTGEMGAPVAAMAEHAPERERASFHPLFAPESAPGRIAVVPDAPGPITDAIRAAFEAGGNAVFETSVEEHDTAMETVQARAHAAVLAFALAAEDVRRRFDTPVSGPLRDLAAQVANGPSGVYGAIQGAFDGAGEVAAAAERIAEASPEAFEELYREAGVAFEQPGPAPSYRPDRESDGGEADRTASGSDRPSG